MKYLLLGGALLALVGCGKPAAKPVSYVDRDLRVDVVTKVHGCTLHRVEYQGQVGYLTTLTGYGDCSFVLVPAAEVK